MEPGTDSGGVFTEFYAGLELPDGALIKQVVFFGEDNDASDIDVSLGRTTINVPVLVGVPTRTDETVNSFTTAGQSGVVAVSSPNNLDEVAGSSGAVILGTNHRFHTINVRLVNVALANHRLCGVEIRYQVPATVGDGDGVPPDQPDPRLRLPQPGLPEPRVCSVRTRRG